MLDRSLDSKVSSVTLLQISYLNIARRVWRCGMVWFGFKWFRVRGGFHLIWNSEEPIRLHKSRTEELSTAQIRFCVLELVTYLYLTVIIFCTLGEDLRLNLLNLNLITCTLEVKLHYMKVQGYHHLWCDAYCLLEIYQSCRGVCCLHVKGILKPKGGGSIWIPWRWSQHIFLKCW
jgi:hypothetical protein